MADSFPLFVVRDASAAPETEPSALALLLWSTWSPKLVCIDEDDIDTPFTWTIADLRASLTAAEAVSPTPVAVTLTSSTLPTSGTDAFPPSLVSIFGISFLSSFFWPHAPKITEKSNRLIIVFMRRGSIKV